MRRFAIILTALIVGALFAVMGQGRRGANFMTTFIVFSGFFSAVGLLVDLGLSAASRKITSFRSRNSTALEK
jgi:hypothetical protein